MKTCLLDVNVLLALAWPNHIHHGRAHAWFMAEDSRSWATCPFTQAGFIRISCNPRIVGRTVYPREALQLLAANTALPHHEFWPDDLPVAEGLAPFSDRLLGHAQVTDAYLLGLAIRRQGILATLDQRLPSLLPEDSPDRSTLQVIPIV